MRIYVDIDDVLCETAASLCGLAAREFGRHVAYEDVGVFDRPWNRSFALAPNMTRVIGWKGVLAACPPQS